ncbi:hypothetical protein [Paraburkholderia xenovorans]|uniref:hypothetical protein n=1 Tax=Paraburkholderia xenovorans TaxID=36873 RepID=UPI0015C58257|nr:hypothetical protein [Paraburkholderia xenovorans]NPT34233.1 hypothetical protein [Paraburkholderia xenovorans]
MSVVNVVNEWGSRTVEVSFGLYAIGQTMQLLASNKALHGKLQNDPGRITVVCYLFSLSAYLTAIAGGWLCWSGQISTDGHAVSETAKWGFFLAGEAVSFQNELAVIAVLLSIVIVPQVMNYLVAGLFGAAGQTRFGAWCLKVVFWTAVKGLSVAGGVCVAWGAIALWLKWPTAYQNKPLDLLGIGLVQIGGSVMVAALTGPLVDDTVAFIRSKSKPIVARLLPIHRWLTRHRTTKDVAATGA